MHLNCVPTAMTFKLANYNFFLVHSYMYVRVYHNNRIKSSLSVSHYNIQAGKSLFQFAIIVQVHVIHGNIEFSNF